MCNDDFDAPEPIASEFRRARKEHDCFACHETIRSGDQYHFEAQKYDDFRTFKHCLRCWAIADAILSAGAESVQWDLNCGVSWREAFGADPPDDVAALAFMTQREAQALAEPR